MCDIARIRFAIQSYIENAIHYTNEGGIILIKLKKTKNDIVFSVQDKGIGIDKNEIPMIFEKFYRIGSEETRKQAGSGLGLYIVSEYVRLHNGSIRCFENTPQGSIFEVILPI
jgi:signal transduction histidine kinase